MLSSLDKDFESTPLNVHYTLDVDDTRLATFGSIYGGEIDINVIRHNVVYETGEYRTIMIPGPTQAAPVVLERGYGNTKALYNWFIQANQGKVSSARKNATITLYVREGGEFKAVVAWNMIAAWPMQISGFESSQEGAAQVARFSITLIAETIERVDP
jgi:phage tail-like protein